MAIAKGEGQYCWNITDPVLLNKIANANNGEMIKSIDFKMANLEWNIEIYPNGMQKDRIGSFDIFLRLLHRPKNWRDIIINLAIQSPQTQSNFVDMVIYNDHAMSWGWDAHTLSLKEVKQAQHDKLMLKISIRII